MINSILYYIGMGFAWVIAGGMVGVMLFFLYCAFRKDELGEELRGCLFAHLAIFGASFLVAIPFIMCERRQDQKKQEPASLYSAPSQSGMVYVCTGPNSERYHKSSDCTGLSRCSDEIEAYSREEARSLGYTPCGICYR